MDALGRVGRAVRRDRRPDPRPAPALAAARRHARATTLDLNALTAIGVELVGRVSAVRDGWALFSGGLRNMFSLADLKLERLLDTFDEWARDRRRSRRRGRRRAGALRADARARLVAAGGSISRSGEIRTILWATGFRPDYSWLARPRRRREGPTAPRRRRGRRQPGDVRARAARAAPAQVDLHPRHRGRCARAWSITSRAISTAGVGRGRAFSPRPQGRREAASGWSTAGGMIAMGDLAAYSRAAGRSLVVAGCRPPQAKGCPDVFS